MIPAEAVEAACASFFQGLSYIHPESKADMQKALEAAAPHMMAEAWEEGRDAEFQRSVMKRQADPNPYKTTS